MQAFYAAAKLYLEVNDQNHAIHQIYILDKLLCETASAISRCAWPSTDNGSDGAAPTPTTTPCKRASMFAIARCIYTTDKPYGT